MFHFFGAITNTKGDALPGYCVRLTDSGGNGVSLYSDANGTPIVNSTGIADTAVVDSNGNASFYVNPGEYNLNVYAADASTLYQTISDIPMGLETITLAAGSSVSTRTGLSAIALPVNGQTATLAESGREGVFVFSASNLSTQVTADSLQGIYVAPSSDTTGASGAWVRKNYTHLTAEMFGALGDNSNDDTSAINTALQTLSTLALGPLYLTPGKTYKITQSLIVPSNTGLAGLSAKKRPVIYMPAASFNNADASSVGRYASNAVGINISGQIVSPFTANTNIVVENLVIQSEVSIGRSIRGIVGRNITDCRISNVELYGFPVGVQICLSSTKRCLVDTPYIHDCADSTDMGSAAYSQITAIEVDNDQVNSIPSEDLEIRSPQIHDITCSGTLLSTYGYQTDGINIANKTCLRTKIVGGSIINVGEGIDNFGCDGAFVGVTISDTYNYGLKFIHGASRNTATGFKINNAGLAAITFAGSSAAGQDTAGNLVVGPTIRTINPNSVWSVGSASAIWVNDNGGTNGKPRDNQVIGAIIDTGINCNYGWYDNSTGTGNYGYELDIKTGPQSRLVYIPNAAGAANLKGGPAYFTNLSPVAFPPKKNLVGVTSATYTPNKHEDVLDVTYTSTGAVTITAPPNWSGTVVDGGNNASVNNITVTRMPSATATASIAPNANSVGGATTGIMTATSVTGVLFQEGKLSGAGVTAGTIIVRQLTGTTGGIGTYEVYPSQTVASTTITMAAEGNISGSASSVINTNRGAKRYEYAGRGNGWVEG